MGVVVAAAATEVTEVVDATVFAAEAAEAAVRAMAEVTASVRTASRTQPPAKKGSCLVSSASSSPRFASEVKPGRQVQPSCKEVPLEFAGHGVKTGVDEFDDVDIVVDVDVETDVDVDVDTVVTSESTGAAVAAGRDIPLRTIWR